MKDAKMVKQLIKAAPKKISYFKVLPKELLLLFCSYFEGKDLVFIIQLLNKELKAVANEP